MKRNLVGLWCNLSRAYEIALLGGFKIKVLFHPDYREGFDDYELIKSFFSGVEFTADDDALSVEIVKPNYDKQIKGCETLEDINNRVNKVRNNELPTVYKNDSCGSLLNVASERLNLSLAKLDKINEVAKVIAKLDKSKNIEAAHVAEAIHYYSYQTADGTIEAETKQIQFGNDIFINLNTTDTSTIEQAIEYLQSKL